MKDDKKKEKSCFTSILKDLHEKESLSQLVNLAINARESRPDLVRGKGWHPSELYPFCPRLGGIKKVFEALRFPFFKEEGMDASTFRVFDVGHALHEWYQEKYFAEDSRLHGVWRCSRCHRTVGETGEAREIVIRELKEEQEKYAIVEPLREGFYLGRPDWKPRPEEPCLCVHTPLFDKKSPNESENLVEMADGICRNICGRDSHKKYTDFDKVRERGGCNHCGKWGEWNYEELHIKNDEYGITGHTDGVIKMNGEWCVLELKSIRTERFYTFQSPHLNYEWQCQLYMFCLGLRKTYIMYVNKNDSCEKEFMIERDDGRLAIFLRGLKNVNEFVDKALAKEGKKIPDSLSLPIRACSNGSSKEAKKCPLAKICFDITEFGELMKKAGLLS